MISQIALGKMQIILRMHQRLCSSIGKSNLHDLAGSQCRGLACLLQEVRLVLSGFLWLWLVSS